MNGFCHEQCNSTASDRFNRSLLTAARCRTETASRLTYFLLRAPDDVSRALSDAVGELKARTRLCSICFNITEKDPCPICQDNSRDVGLIAVVEEPLDALALERTGSYKGRYHVLHGAIRLSTASARSVEVAGTGEPRPQRGRHRNYRRHQPRLEGDATAMYIQKELQSSGVHVTRLARGLPTGGDLEYVDMMTLTRALQGRHAL